MNSDHQIYRAPANEIPEEDKARLDGFLAGKAEDTEMKRLMQEKAELLARLEKEAES